MSELIEFLQANSEDRGVRAALRCALRPSQEMRAWPYLAPFGGIGAGHDAETVRTVAGIYAACYSPEFSALASIGQVCRALCSSDEDPAAYETNMSKTAAQPGPMARRFAYLINADRTEICARVARLMVYAKSQGIGVNYEQLEQDLRTWPRARTAWARDFWGRAPREEGIEGGEK